MIVTPANQMLLGLGCIVGVAGGFFNLAWPLVKRLADWFEARNKNRRRDRAARKGVAVDVGHKVAAAKRAGLAPAAAILFPSRPTRGSSAPAVSETSSPTSKQRSPHSRPTSPWRATN